MIPRTNMTPMEIVVALDEHGGFGKDGQIPWHFKEDLKRFKDLTNGHICIMGRKTYDNMLQMTIERESKKKKVLPGIKKYLEAIERGENDPKQHLSGTIKEILPTRECYVITSNPRHFVIGATISTGLREVINSLEESDKRKVFVIGGFRLWIEALPWTETVHVTMIEGTYHCDIHFPMKYLNSKFVIQKATREGKLSFITYRRVDRS